MYLLYTYVAMLVIGGFAVYEPSFAATSEITVLPMEGAVGETIAVTLSIDTDVSANAFEAVMTYPATLLQYEGFDDSASVLNFWVSKPEATAAGIHFSGITPGGFMGKVDVVTLYFKAQSLGKGAVTLDAVQLLKNDGLGTLIPFSPVISPIVIGAGIPSHTAAGVVMDDEDPEAFRPEVVRDADVFDGAYFLVFSTEDKSSGIDHYEVKEGVFGWWREAESPYVLKNQKLSSTIYVRAIDRVGNTRNAIVYPLHPQTFEITKYTIVGILIVCAIFCLFMLRRRRRSAV